MPNQPEPASKQVTKSVLEVIEKVLVILVSVIYLTGAVVRNGRLIDCGFAWQFELLKTAYIWAGVWTIVPIWLVNSIWSVVLLLRRSEEVPSSIVLQVGGELRFGFESRPRRVSYWISFVALVLFVLCLVGVLGHPLEHARFGVIVLIIVFSVRYIFQQLVRSYSQEDFSAASSSVLTLLVLWLFYGFLFSKLEYPYIPAALGGGMPWRMDLVLDSKETDTIKSMMASYGSSFQAGDSTVRNVYCMGETGEDYLIMIPASEKSYFGWEDFTSSSCSLFVLRKDIVKLESIQQIQ